MMNVQFGGGCGGGCAPQPRVISGGSGPRNSYYQVVAEKGGLAFGLPLTPFSADGQGNYTNLADRSSFQTLA